MGNTTISLTDYLTATEIARDYCSKVDYNTLTNEVTAIKSNITTHVNNTDIHVTKTKTDSWDKVTDKVDKTDVTTTVDATSTDTQVPSAKAVYEFNKIKTYTKLEQLSLESGCSTGDVFNALPDNSYFEMGCNLSKTDKLYHVSDIPLEYGLLTIRKYDKTRFSIELKPSGGSIISPNELYIGQLKGSDGSNLSWQRVCTTNTADVDVTNITMNSNYVNNPICKYQVVNGICYIDFMSGTYKLTSNMKGVAIASGLPIPKTGQTCITYVPWSSGDANKQVILFVNNKGEILLHTNSSANGCPIFCSLSYPVK